MILATGRFRTRWSKPLLKAYQHEDISIMLMNKLNREFDGKLAMAIEIFNGTYP